MDRKIASDLAETILLSTKLAGKYKLKDSKDSGYIESFHTFANDKESLGIGIYTKWLQINQSAKRRELI
ncbi:hypothetical protein [Photobacterium profundum]|uniref:hypothetical protein n=1 Tax=Photobacterium profundum TaxID=74109 RepID=UPI0003228346|nr:hypothetical protein [Photobacterium profundum]